MATIYAKTGSEYMFATRSWHDPNTWDGGVVPTIADTVFVGGLSTQAPYSLNPISYDSRWGILTEPYQGSNRMTYWPGVATGFSFSQTNGSGSIPPSGSGSLFTYTVAGNLVKFNYGGIVQNNTYIYPDGAQVYGSYIRDVEVDTSFYPWLSSTYPITASADTGDWIPSSTSGQPWFVPSGLIVVSGSQTASFADLIINSGSRVHLYDSASAHIGRHLRIRTGEFKASGSCTLEFKMVYSASGPTNTGNDNSMNFIMHGGHPGSTFILEGPEVRTNTTLTSPVTTGSYFIDVASTTGFAEGDYIFVGERDVTILSASRAVDEKGYSGSVGLLTNYLPLPFEDECFYVAATGSGKLFLHRAAGVQGTVFATASATEIITHEDKFNVGDKIIVNGQTASILAIDTYEYLQNDYDFTNGTVANLNDFYIPGTSGSSVISHFYQATEGWKITPGVGLSNVRAQTAGTNPSSYNTDPWRALLHRNVYLRNVKTETWISNALTITASATDPYRNAAFSGTFHDVDQVIRLQINRAPTTLPYLYEWPNNTQNIGFGAHSEAAINPLNRTIFVAPGNQYSDNATNIGIRPEILGVNLDYLHKYTLQSDQTELKLAVDDTVVYERILDNLSTPYGTVGVMLGYTPHTVTITKMKIWAIHRKLTLSNPVTGITPGQTIYESGVEYPHTSGQVVTKLYTHISDPLDFDDLADPYYGSPEISGDTTLPNIFSVNNMINGYGTSSRYFDGASFGGADAARATARAIEGIYTYDYARMSDSTYDMTYDLGAVRTFNTVGFAERLQNGQVIRYANPITISGSVDYATWVPLTASTDLRPRLTTNGLRDFNVGTQNFRYIRMTYPSHNQGVTTLKMFRVINNVSNRIRVNNAGDLNIGDHIAIIYKKGPLYTEYYGSKYHTYPYIQAGSSSLDVVGGYNDYYVITGKSGNTLTLNEPITRHRIRRGDLVVKVNKALQVKGSYSSGSFTSGRIFNNYANDWTYPQVGMNTISKNVAYRNLHSNFPYWSEETTAWRVRQSGNTRKLPLIFDGNSMYDCLGETSPALWNVSNMISRKNYSGVRCQFAFIPYVYQSYTEQGIMRSTGNIEDTFTSTANTSEGYTRYINSSYNTIFNKVMINVGRQSQVPWQYKFTQATIHRNQGFGMYCTIGGVRSDQNPINNTYQLFAQVTSNRISDSSSPNALIQNGEYKVDVPYTNTIIDLPYYSSRPNWVSYPPAPALIANTNFYYQTYPFYYAQNVYFNYNRWGRHVTRTNNALVVKKPAENYLYFYPNYVQVEYGTGADFQYNAIAEGAVQDAMLACEVVHQSNTTASLTIGFDYYNSAGIQAKIFGKAYRTPQTTSFGSTNQYEQNPYYFDKLDTTAGSGKLKIMIFKERSLVSVEFLEKSMTPVSITRTYQMADPGTYQYYILASSNNGYYAFNNITSTLITSDPSRDSFTGNTINQNYWNSLFQVSSSTNYSYTDNLSGTHMNVVNTAQMKKFRLVGARLS